MRERWIVGGIALAIVVAAAVFTLGRGRRSDAATSEPEAASSPAPEAIDPSLFVPSETSEDPVEPAGGPTRSPVPTAQEGAPAGRAVVVVRAVAAGTSTPLANVVIGFFRGDVTFTAPILTEEWHEEIARSDSEFSKEYWTLSDSCETDASGIVELSVPAGKGFTIQASCDDPSLEDTRLDVPALAADERREVTIEIAQARRIFLGRVVEREGEAPVRSAVVTLVDNGEKTLARTESDASGAFSFQVAHFVGKWIVRIEAPGFAVALGELSEGHEEPGREAVFRLRSAAALFGRVTLADGTASPGSLVLAKWKRGQVKQPAEAPLGWGDDEHLTQGGVTDDAGSYRLEGLPPSVRLEVSAFGEGKSLTSEPAAITLAPGEERELSMVLEPIPVLDVLVVDERGAPVPGLELWLAKDSGLYSGRASPRYFDEEEPERTVVSDEAGRCRFDAIAKGIWFLGPGRDPSQTGFDADFSPRTQEVTAEGHTYPAIGQPIRVQAGEQEIKLSLRHGGSIGGRVVDPEGRPVPWALIDCRSDDYGWVPGARSGSDGTFRTYQLAEGDYRLSASGEGEGSLGRSPEVVARAGAQDVVLTPPLLQKCRVHGRVTGFEGGGETGVMAWSIARPTWMAGEEVDENGEFEFSDLEAGLYRFSVASDDERFGLLTDVDVRPGMDPLLIELRPGARLVVRCETPHLVGIQVYRDGVLATGSIAVEGSSPAIVVPAGDLEVRLFPDLSLTEPDWGVPSLTKTVSVPTGSEVELVFP